MQLFTRVAQKLKKRFSVSPAGVRSWSKELETDQERRAMFLRVLNRSWLIMGAVALVSFFYYPAERASLTVFFIFSIGTYFLVRFINRANRTWLAGFIFTSLVNTSFFGAFLIIGFQEGFAKAIEQYQYVLMMMGLAIIFAGAFIHRWAAFSLAALNSILLIFITQALAPEAGPVLSVHIFWWLVATCIWLYETSLFSALARLQQTRTGLENQVALRTQSLQDTVTRLERTQESLQAKNQQLEAFSYSISHDLRAPLRAIDGYASVLQEDYASSLDPEGERLLGRMQANVRLMDHMIQNMLYLSHLDRHTMQWQAIDLNRMVREVIEELRKKSPEQPVAIHVEILPPCRADSALLRQVLTHLIDNALKFSNTRNPAYITIASQHGPPTTVYSVRDNGVGFDMSQAHRLFAPFQRLHHADEFEGSGVGLAIVQRIIQKHNGRIWAEAEVDHGATFYFTLGEPLEGDDVIDETLEPRRKP